MAKFVSRVLVAVPARLASARYPDKLLQEHRGMTVLARTLTAALHCAEFADVLLCCDDQRLADEAIKVGWPVDNILVDPRPCASGTARVARAIEAIPFEHRPNVVVNWQADEIDVTAGDVRLLIRTQLDSAARIARPNVISTMVQRLDARDVLDRNVVKACRGAGPCSSAVWFDRGDHRPTGWDHHIGVYAYGLNTLLRMAAVPPTDVALECDLEQLTWLQEGACMPTVKVSDGKLAINAPEDFQRLVGRAFE